MDEEVKKRLLDFLRERKRLLSWDYNGEIEEIVASEIDYIIREVESL